MTYIKKNFFIIFLSIYFVVGAFYSLNTGLAFDEFHEQRNWEYNVALVKHFIFQAGIGSAYENNPTKYYGIGFQIISQPIQFFLASIILKFQNINGFGAHLIAKHAIVFTSFFISGIFVYLIVSKIVNNKFFCTFVTLL